MFLKKLYGYHKTMFLLFVGYLLAFLFINYKWGMVATPVLQYGMYSGKHRLSDTIIVYSVIANNRLIEPAQLSSMQNDFVQTYLGLYPAYKENNLLVNATFKNYLGFLPGGDKPAVHLVTDEQFAQWFKKKMQSMVAEPIQTLGAIRQNFLWVNGKMLAIENVSKLKFLDAH